jgi:D-glycerate 3-kinase
MSPHPIPTLIHEIIQSIRARNPERPALVGVGGAQGSGKSYHCRLLALAHQPRIAHFSLDDVYLTRAERERLAREAHPLFITRGPPGTHDIPLAIDTISKLQRGEPARLPRFDKTCDDRASLDTWPEARAPVDAILIDGWCMGATPMPDGPPINAVEREDENGVWRRTMLNALEQQYAPFFANFDAIVYLQAPNWEIVRLWRGQQEERTLGRPLTADENAALDRFVMHYERITRAMLAGHHMAKWIVHLDEARNVVRVEER